MSIRKLLVLLTLTSTLTVAGCGDDGSTNAGTTNAGSETAKAEMNDDKAGDKSKDMADDPAGQKSDDMMGEEKASGKAETPDSLNFTSETIDGETFNGAELAGKPTVLWFWAAWCPKCRGSAPTVKDAAGTFGESVNFVGVAGKSDAAEAEAFVSDFGLSGITHLAEANDPLWTTFDITYQHQYVIIDRDGMIVHRGPLGDEELTDKLNELTA